MNPDAKPAKVTLRDIARKARVSHVTVARALRNEDCVRLATRERIMALAREMGYTPDPVMSRLMRQIRVPPDHRECEVIGVIDCGLSGHVQKDFRRLFDAVEEQLLHMGYHADRFRLGEDGLSAARLRGVLEARNIAGVLFVAPGRSEIEGPEFSSLLRVKLPFLSDSPGVIHVGRDPHASYRIVYEQLRKRGYRRVGFAMRSCIRGFEHSAIHGCLQTMAPMPVEPDFQPFFSYDEHDQHSSLPLRAWIERNQLEAVVGGAHAYPFLRQTGLRIPSELGFVCTNLDPAMTQTGVTFPLRAIGRAAVQTLDSALHANLYGRPETSQLVLIPGKWREGDSLVERAAMNR